MATYIKLIFYYILTIIRRFSPYKSLNILFLILIAIFFSFTETVFLSTAFLDESDIVIKRHCHFESLVNKIKVEYNKMLQINQNTRGVLYTEIIVFGRILK